MTGYLGCRACRIVADMTPGIELNVPHCTQGPGCLMPNGAEIMRRGIEDFLAGNYEHPERHRLDPKLPRQCPHGVAYWQHHCEACDEAHFRDVLARADAAGVRDA